MLTLRGNVVPAPTPLDRRSFLTLGAVTPLGLSLPQLLAAGESRSARSDVSIVDTSVFVAVDSTPFSEASCDRAAAAAQRFGTPEGNGES